MALLTGGAMTAAGLYVSSAALRGTYVASRRFLSWLIPNDTSDDGDAPNQQNSTVVTYDHCSKTNTSVALVARDQGGGLLIVPNGVFYLKAPGLWLYNLLPIESSTLLRMDPHAHYLFQAALSWMPDATTTTPANTTIMNAEAWNHLIEFTSECVLHMLLNDIARNAWPTPSEKRLVLDIFTTLSPVRGWWSAGDRPTAQMALDAITLEQWSLLQSRLPITTTSTKVANRFRTLSLQPPLRWLGVTLPSITVKKQEISFQCVVGFVVASDADTTTTTKTTKQQTVATMEEGVGACSLWGRMGYCLSIVNNNPTTS